MFYANIIKDAKKQDEEVRRNAKIPAVSKISLHLGLADYYKVKMEVKLLIEDDVKKFSNLPVV